MKNIFCKGAIFSLILLFFYSNFGFCSEVDKLDARIKEAKEVLTEIMMMPEEKIPQALLRSAKAIGIFPSVVKGAFIVGGSFGKGIIISKNQKTEKWGPPAFFGIGGLSAGYQIGAQSADIVFVIPTERGLRGLLKNKVTLGGDLAVAAGPVGRKAQADSDVLLKGGIFSYSRTKGLFAGISLKGAVIKFDKRANEIYYEKGITAYNILFEGKGIISKSAEELIRALNTYTASVK
jgi:lipid-binding SYLF domain-containing protein